MVNALTRGNQSMGKKSAPYKRQEGFRESVSVQENDIAVQSVEMALLSNADTTQVKFLQEDGVDVEDVIDIADVQLADNEIGSERLLDQQRATADFRSTQDRRLTFDKPQNADLRVSEAQSLEKDNAKNAEPAMVAEVESKPRLSEIIGAQILSKYRSVPTSLDPADKSVTFEPTPPPEDPVPPPYPANLTTAVQVKTSPLLSPQSNNTMERKSVTFAPQPSLSPMNTQQQYERRSRGPVETSHTMGDMETFLNPPVPIPSTPPQNDNKIITFNSQDQEEAQK